MKKTHHYGLDDDGMIPEAFELPSKQEVIVMEGNGTVHEVLPQHLLNEEDAKSTSALSTVSDQEEFEYKPVTNLVEYFSDENNRKQIDVVLHCLAKLEEESSDKTKAVEHNGKFQFLCNILYELDKYELEFYILQLLNTYMMKAGEGESHLERYILEICAHSMHFGIKLSWLLDAELYTLENQLAQSPSNIKLKKRAQRGMIFRNLVEKVTINQVVPINYMNDNFLNTSILQVDAEVTSEEPTDEEKSKMTSFVLQNVFSKQRRSNYFNDEHYFVHTLTDLSYRLKAYPPGDIRKHRMKAELERINQTIPYGVYYPLCDSKSKHCRILRVCTDACRVFSTKERVPILCVFEVVQSEHTCNQPENILQFEENPDGEYKVWDCLIDKTVDAGQLIKPKSTLKKENSSSSIKVPFLEEKRSSIVSNAEPLPTNNSPLIGKPVHTRSTSELPILHIPNLNNDEFVLIEKSDADKHLEEVAQEMDSVFGESFEKIKAKYRALSPYGSIPGWDLKSVIVKANDDIRQEIFAMQLIKLFAQIFEEEKLPIYIRPYEIIVTSGNCGMLETVRDTVSIDGLKKKFPNFTTLKDYFIRVYGSPTSNTFIRAQTNFVESVVGYSLITYILQIKDRHNGNILLDREGHMIHIDFGFFLGISPGGVKFENSPFKLPQDWVDLMGELFDLHFRPVFYVAYSALRKPRNMNRLLNLVEMMIGANYKCFDNNHANIMRDLRNRFYPNLSDDDFAKMARKLVDDSMDNWFTKKYDQYQYLTNGIL
ncbi:hypothetical protein FDP41_000770 [Naegleria fowleri]|uniref:1-phosphatidylinositol 4-kinase n=1 Tax=Naegleria fowleri TaxID=5763 RepID=A0A6A5CC59_NAEFO|nr:uncharacterized protein FDP41_000770 [Naegleria fowleri]KAF0984871.1 hypothetical protein FDP41_000770 [Naegleria fowleri]CAG4714698.1 unnamed protein product [Naegleria fowleri]